MPMSAFNTADALARLMDNKKLYQKLLDKFAAGYTNYDAQIDQALADGKMDEGVHLAHTMKGLAGNLGAVDLQEASRELEMLFRGGDAGADFAPLVEKFKAELNRALDEIKAGLSF